MFEKSTSNDLNPCMTKGTSNLELISQLQKKNAQLEAVIENLSEQNHLLQLKLENFQVKLEHLQGILAKNSSNSSKPPSSDGLKKPPKTRSQRGASGKKPGGQKGRKGTTLNRVEKPDYIVIHAPTACTGCGFNLEKVESNRSENRQVFEVPEPKIEVTEHQAVVKTCPCCGITSKGKFPESIKAPVQYGERIQALAVYFQHQHFVPIDRTCQIFKDVFGVTISPGTCANIDQKLFKNLEIFEANLKTYLLAAKVLHFDETGMRCDKKLNWVHVTSSESATFYGIHKNRGQEAIEAFNILPQFSGIAIHDHWFPYFTYEQVTHGLCNAHHLRELDYMYNEEKEEWASEMRKLLLKAKKEVKRSQGQGVLLKDCQLEIEKQYAQIIASGYEYHATLPPLPKGKRGRQKQRAGKNFLDRLRDKQSCVLLFMYDFNVPFTNNLGEQDIRMNKVKQKISGCFRKFHCGEIFCRIRSYISTARKQKWKIWDSLIEAIRGSPRLLPVYAS
jgi:transposase